MSQLGTAKLDVSEAVAVAKVSFGRLRSMMSSSSETDIPMSKSSSPSPNLSVEMLEWAPGNLWIEIVECVQTRFFGVPPHWSVA